MAVHPDDDFFEPGGNSLSAVRFGAALRARGLPSCVRAMFWADMPRGSPSSLMPPVPPLECQPEQQAGAGHRHAAVRRSVRLHPLPRRPPWPARRCRRRPAPPAHDAERFRPLW
ncbi:acyl carrier protein [Streptomyces olindensis]|uniref:Acyl carrier protein n=1 Tax=Streptomyces olindensis TaxID=358823 RepID=A0ABV2Y1U2_9ACTN